VVTAAAGCGGAPPPSRTPTPVATATAAPVREPALAVGITEPNANLVFAPAARELPPEFARWRDELGRIRPGYYRLVLDWARLQPDPAAPPNLEGPDGGCSREGPPCAEYGGLRDQLRAIASRQREGGWETLVTVTNTPPWAAGPATGCEDASGGVRSQVPRPDAVPAYRTLIASVLSAAADEGAELRWWSPWNEPNHPYFLQPQRRECAPDSPSGAPAAYAGVAAEMRGVLDAAPGEQRLAIGELAGLLEPTPRGTTVEEFIAGLPRELVCAADVWTQHAYIGGTDPVDAVARALAAHGCPTAPPIWITETGVGGADSRLSIARGITSERQGCRMLHARLRGWWRDPRVSAAFQYTFREDEAFPTGLVAPALDRGRRSLAVWQAWGSRPRPDAPPPRPRC
jgi:hypothetical protein